MQKWSKHLPRLLTVFPAALLSLFPNAACPACWPAYIWLLGAVGISLVDVGPYVLPLTVLALLAAIGSLGYRARRRRGYGPLALGIPASALILIGKVTLPPADAHLYAGIVLKKPAWSCRRRFYWCSAIRTLELP